jgi:hypothetical protein
VNQLEFYRLRDWGSFYCSTRFLASLLACSAISAKWSYMDICSHKFVFSNNWPIFSSNAIVEPARLILLHQTICASREDSSDILCSAIPPEAWAASCSKILNVPTTHASIVLDIFSDCFPGDRCTLRHLLLFMFVCKHFFSASLVSPTDTAWPSPPSPGRRLLVATSPRSLAMQAVSREKARAMTFIRKHAADLLDIASLGSENVTSKAFKFLAFVMPVNDANLPPAVKINGHIPLVEAIKWVHAQHKDFADPCNSVVEPVLSDTTTVCLSADALSVVIHVKGGSVIVSQTDLPHDTSNFHLRVESCENSFVFVLAAFKSITVIGCTNSSIFCGVCSAAARIEHCETCNVQVAALRMFASNVVDSDIYLLTPKSPIICGECRSLRIAPFNIFAPNLQSLLNSAGLGIDRCATSRWDTPIFLDLEGCFRQKSESALGPGVSLLPPSLFFPCSVPVPGVPERSLTPIPPDFAKHIEDKMRNLSAVKAQLSQATASSLGAKGHQVILSRLSFATFVHFCCQLRDSVQLKFNEWLV